MPTAFAPLDWHIHEMLYGYVAAVVAGFLLTAIPNWTGRLPINGAPLAALALLWLAGRIADADLGEDRADRGGGHRRGVSRRPGGRGCCARSSPGANWRNLRVLGVLGVLIVGNVVVPLPRRIQRGAADYGTRIGIAAIDRR